MVIHAAKGFSLAGVVRLGSVTLSAGVPGAGRRPALPLRRCGSWGACTVALHLTADRAPEAAWAQPGGGGNEPHLLSGSRLFSTCAP